MNSTVTAALVMDVVLVLVIAPSSILVSSYLQYTAVERDDINRFAVAIHLPKVTVLASVVAIAIYVVELGWVQYFSITLIPCAVAAVIVEHFTGDMGMWPELRELYLSHDGEDWTAEFAEDGI